MGRTQSEHRGKNFFETLPIVPGSAPTKLQQSPTPSREQIGDRSKSLLAPSPENGVPPNFRGEIVQNQQLFINTLSDLQSHTTFCVRRVRKSQTVYANSVEKVFPPAVHLGEITVHSRSPQNLGQSLCPKGLWEGHKVNAGGKTFLKHVALTPVVTSKCFTA